MSDWSSDVCSADLITLIAIGADVAQCYRGGRPGRNLGHRPKHLVETLLAAVERIGAVVDGHLIRLAVERELALGDAVGEIGRASCRERVCQYVSISVVAVSLNKKSTL